MAAPFRRGSGLLCDSLGEAGEDAVPAGLVADRVVGALAVGKTFEVTVFQLDRRLSGLQLGEAHLDLAGVRRIGVVLPVAVDLPGHDETVRWLPDQDTSPVAFAAVVTDLEPAPAHARLY